MTERPTPPGRVTPDPESERRPEIRQNVNEREGSHVPPAAGGAGRPPGGDEEAGEGPQPGQPDVGPGPGQNPVPVPAVRPRPGRLPEVRRLPDLFPEDGVRRSDPRGPQGVLVTRKGGRQ